jgi:hypothetical protein
MVATTEVFVSMTLTESLDQFDIEDVSGLVQDEVVGHHRPECVEQAMLGCTEYYNLTRGLNAPRFAAQSILSGAGPGPTSAPVPSAPFPQRTLSVHR